MSQSLTTRQSKPKTLDPQKKIQVVYSLNQFEKALEDNNNEKLESEEIKNLVNNEKQKIQDAINRLRHKVKLSGGSQKNVAGTDALSSLNTGATDNNASASGLQANKTAAASTILVPPVEICPLDIKKTAKFQRPDHYIRFPVHKEFVSGIRLEDNSIVHYNMVKADEEFLNELRANVKGGGNGVSEIDFIKMIDLMEKSTARGAEISFDEAIQLTRDRNINVRNQIALIIYRYWKMRRQKLGKPLLRNFWPITSPHDSSPYACFRPRVKEKMTLRRPRRNNKEMFDKLEKLLDDFRKVEKTFRKLKQRDEKKLLLAELDICIFDQKRHEIFDPYYRSPLWDRLKNYKLQKKQQKKEMRNSLFSNFGFASVPGGGAIGSNYMIGSGSSNLAQIGGSLNVINDISMRNINVNDLNLFLKQISIDICNLDVLLNYSWDDEISLLSYYYFGTLMLSSSVFNPIKNCLGNKSLTLTSGSDLADPPVSNATSNEENLNSQHISDNESSFSADNNYPSVGEASSHEPDSAVDGDPSHTSVSPAFQRMALPNYILSIYKNGVNLSRLESLRNFRTPCIPHRLVRRRGRGGRIWFDRHSLNKENYEPLFTDPYQLDYSANCGNSNQFMLDSYFRKSMSMCGVVDRLCTESNFDAYGNDTHGASNVSSSSVGADNGSVQGSHLLSGGSGKNSETPAAAPSAPRSRGRNSQANNNDANSSRLSSNKNNQQFMDVDMPT